MTHNMDYCKFENTLEALRQCHVGLEEDVDALSSDERKARIKLLELCAIIAEDNAAEIREMRQARLK